MADAPGDEVAVVLLRALPAEVGELILARLDAGTAERLRARLRAAPPEAPPGPELDGALAQFFDLQRIANRPVPTAAGANPPAEPPAPDPVAEIRTLPADRLVRALDGEQPGAIALVLSCLDAASAGQVIRRMPTEIRAEIALRITKLGSRNQALLQQLARAVTEKARRLADVPPEPTQDELISNLADMLRALPRDERSPVIERIQAADAPLAAKVLEKLYRIDDLLKIADRQLQGLLAELDVKTIAIALKNTAPAVRGKVTSNMSSRSRAVLDEESELLGDVADSRIREAQSTVLALVRKGEEEGKITIQE